jgi:hypothetical protein
LGGHAGFGEGATVTPLLFLTTFFLATGFLVAVAVGFGVAFVVAPIAVEEATGVARGIDRSIALAIRIGSARDLIRDSI